MEEWKKESSIYQEFLTNTAVAWFSAGIIAPVFTKRAGLIDLLSSGIAIVFSYVFLQLAIYYKEKGERL